MKKAKIIAALLLLFITGIAVGAAGTKYMLDRRWRSFAGGQPRDKVERLLDRLVRDLDLTTIQENTVKAVLTDGMQELEALRKQTKPAFDAIHRKSMERISQVLDDKQKRQLAELDRRLKNRFEQPPPPPGRRESDANGEHLPPMPPPEAVPPSDRAQ